jgi:hypothetical protein
MRFMEEEWEFSVSCSLFACFDKRASSAKAPGACWRAAALISAGRRQASSARRLATSRRLPRLRGTAYPAPVIHYAPGENLEHVDVDLIDRAEHEIDMVAPSYLDLISRCRKLLSGFQIVDLP